MTQTELKSRSGASAARAVDAATPRRAGRWNLVEQAAGGSWALVFRARPVGASADRPAAYAVKVLRPEHADDPRIVALLAREAQVGRNVSHPHLVPVLEAHVSRAPQFVVMPWLEGATLAQRQAAGEHLDLPVALWIARQVAEALAALDAAGWMHGDIKPSNLMLSPEGHLTLLDLGFARRRDEDSLAGERTILGTGNYLAPEYLTTALVPDIRSDLYSLGVVLFEMLSGRLPFEGQDLAELAVQHKQAAPPDLRTLAPLVPSGRCPGGATASGQRSAPPSTKPARSGVATRRVGNRDLL